MTCLGWRRLSEGLGAEGISVAEPAHGHSPPPLWAFMPSFDQSGMLLASRQKQVGPT